MPIPGTVPVKHATPEWNEHDYELCRRYDEKVRRGEMSYRMVPVR